MKTQVQQFSAIDGGQNAIGEQQQQQQDAAEMQRPMPSEDKDIEEEELVEDQHHSLQEIRREQLMKQGLAMSGGQNPIPAIYQNHF